MANERTDRPPKPVLQVFKNKEPVNVTIAQMPIVERMKEKSKGR